MLAHVGELWRTYRSRLKKLYFDPKKSQQQIVSKVPLEVDKQQWIDLAAYWFSAQSKKLSSIGKASRAEKAHYHTTGLMSFAQKKHQFKKKFKREPSNLEFMEITHKRKEGSYV